MNATRKFAHLVIGRMSNSSRSTSSGALRNGFRRYVMAVQYHGSSFLGFTLQHANAENCILPNGTDVRGYVSVERRIRLALSEMLNGMTSTTTTAAAAAAAVTNRTSDNDHDSNSISISSSSSSSSSSICHYENIQVSSRTDRGVHAIKNTFHVDIRVDNDDDVSNNEALRIAGCSSYGTDQHIVQRCGKKHLFQSTERMLRSMNYFLRRTNPTSSIYALYSNDKNRNIDDKEDFINDSHDNEPHGNDDPMLSPLEIDTNHNHNFDSRHTTAEHPPQQIRHFRRRHNDTQYYCGGEWVRRCPAEEIRILSIQEAPRYMSNTVGYEMYQQPPIIDWNVRFSAISRTYVYRIMYSVNEPDWGVPFEWDRSWRIYDNQYHASQHPHININDMRIAASYLMGTHDFTAFRAAGCQRHTAIMTLSDITISMEPYDTYERLLLFGSLQNTPTTTGSSSLDAVSHNDQRKSNCYIITIRYVGDSFLYRQVRKMTACLISVGRGKMSPTTVRDILLQKDAGRAPYTAPPQGLYLVDVKHDGITI